MGRFRRATFVAVGYVFVAIRAIGVVIPILPTTPFLILAAICFGGGSPRAKAWLENNRVFGEYIENYRAGAGVSRTRKAYAIAFL